MCQPADPNARCAETLNLKESIQLSGPFMFADIVLSKNFSRSFTYHIPLSLAGKLSPGSFVLVPFGPTIQVAIVVRIFENIPPGHFRQDHPVTFKDLLTLVPSQASSAIDSGLVSLAGQLSEYYLAPLGTCLRLMQPLIEQPFRISHRLILCQRTPEPAKESETLKQAQLDILDRLTRHPRGLTLATLKKHIPSADKTVRQLKRLGWLQDHYLIQPKTERGILPHRALETSPDHSHNWPPSSTRSPQDSSSYLIPADSSYEHLFPEVSPWRHQLNQALSDHRSTEMYLWSSPSQMVTALLQAIQDTLNHQRSILVITPYLGRCRFLMEQARQRWGDLVTFYHRGLSTHLQTRLRRNIQTGIVRIVIGTRSTLFTPIPDLGLIWVDQEENELLKEEQRPYYHVRTAAKFLSRSRKAVLLLASSHPSLEAYHASFKSKFLFPNISSPQTGQAPNIELIHLGQTPHTHFLTDTLVTHIRCALAKQERVLIYVNRKGFSRSLLCKTCGHVPICSPCRIPFVVYKSPPHLFCAYCGQKQPIPSVCPECHGIHLEALGTGTERMEDMIRQHFPDAGIGRFDRDTVHDSVTALTLRDQFQQGAIQILVGTQMMLPMFSSPFVGFLAIPHADAGLHVPDFRSAERVYQQLHAAVQLTKPRQLGGKVVIQTFLPTHHVIQSIFQQDPNLFYQQELAFREALGYPPFSHLVLLLTIGNTPQLVEAAARKWTSLLQHHLFSSSEHPCPSIPSVGDTVILGPMLASPSRAQGTSCIKILVKTKTLSAARAAIRASLQQLELEETGKRVRFLVNVDPEEIL